ncbi:MAG: anaerobic glycerol-3-phosphate dehydrogenase subunit B [Mailhella sp.]|nr:anaerobic glycerol-3-phosphate dehydrogenase subunit B [Mailhella sp.]
MNRKTDIVVVGSGIAGMSAALAAAQNGKQVTLITHGVGSLAISSGCIDVLGYAGGTAVTDPFEAISSLPEEHPYRLVGEDSVRSSLDWFNGLCRKGGLSLLKTEEGNRRLVTVMGTFKPSYLVPDSFCSDALDDVHRIAVVTVEDMKDVHPGLIIDQLKRYPDMAEKEFVEAVLPNPIHQAHRNITPMDIARYVETPEGLQWLKDALVPYAKLYPVLLLPPICGMKHSQQIWNQLCTALNAKIVEMVSIPPGVAGMRLREIFKKALNAAGVYFVENAEVVRSEVEEGVCKALTTVSTGGENRWEADSFIIATGGLLGGGIGTAPGKAWESIFSLPIDMPENTEEWSSPDIFGNSLFARMGVKANKELKPVDAEGNIILNNVRFAGRILGGYDFASEKSGHGVALATGWYAGTQAAKE